MSPWCSIDILIFTQLHVINLVSPLLKQISYEHTTPNFLHIFWILFRINGIDKISWLENAIYPWCTPFYIFSQTRVYGSISIFLFVRSLNEMSGGSVHYLWLSLLFCVLLFVYLIHVHKIQILAVNGVFTIFLIIG